jgi:hypothetical protein
VAPLADHRVHDDLVAVLVHPGGVAAQDHRQPLLRQPDPAQRPQVVVVERGRAHGDRGPAVRGDRVRPVARLQALERLVLVDGCCVDGEHATTLLTGNLGGYSDSGHIWNQRHTTMPGA